MFRSNNEVLAAKLEQIPPSATYLFDEERFIAVTDCSTAGLKTVILNLTNEYGIDLTKCRGQGYDGANVISGVYGGLQTLIKEHAPNADYVHCAAHALNFVLNDAARHFAAEVVPVGRLFCRQLQRASRMFKEKRPKKSVMIPKPALNDCRWWLNYLKDEDQLFWGEPSILLTTDASDSGYGIQLDQHLLSGSWTMHQMK
nr:unnamed protein product [Callosobruchus analis]